MKLLLISNSTNAGEPYLQWPLLYIQNFLKGKSKIVFIPFAAVTFSYEKYEDMVNSAFSDIGINVTSIHRYGDKKSAIQNADAVITGGGNTFKLVSELYNFDLLNVIREQIIKGTPYVGWSAGSNLACPTLRTTNDMPIVEPESFNTLNLVPFQINPHYLDANPSGHAGETREQRINEFIQINQNIYVAGLREATLLEIIDDSISLRGDKPLKVFKFGESPKEYSSTNDINFLMK